MVNNDRQNIGTGEETGVADFKEDCGSVECKPMPCVPLKAENDERRLTLIYELDLRILKTYMRFKNELSRSKLSEVRALGYWQTHRHMRPKHYTLLLH